MIKINLALKRNETEIRSLIDENINANITKKTLFGYRKGLHFKKNEKIIYGFYSLDDDDPDRRGSPLRIYFCGRIITDSNNVKRFVGLIYPSVFQFLLMIVLLLTAVFSSETLVPAVIYTIVFFIFLYFIIKGEIELHHTLENFFT